MAETSTGAAKNSSLILPQGWAMGKMLGIHGLAPLEIQLKHLMSFSKAQIGMFIYDGS